MASLVLAAGCAPILNVEGSFFPAWLVCLVAGILLTALVRPVLAKSGLEPHVGPVLVIYPSLCLLFTFGIWLVFYRS